jgi:hypothetical protein
MSLHMKQSDTRSQLQDKLAKELQDRAKQKALIETETPDGVTDSAYLKETKSTTSLAWVWVVIVLAIIVLAIWLLVSTI